MAFVRTIKVDELPPGTLRELCIEGKAVAVANVGGKYTQSIIPACIEADHLGRDCSREKW